MPVLTTAVRRILLVLACVAALGCTGIGWWVNSLRAENKRLGDAVATLTADLNMERELRLVDQAVAKRYAKDVAKLTTKQRTRHAKLQTALTSNASWAAQTVPDSVADALGMPEPTPAQ